MPAWKFDFSKITVREYRLLFDKTLAQDTEDELVAKVAGITKEDVQNLPFTEYRKFMKAFIEAATAPVDENPT